MRTKAISLLTTAALIVGTSGSVAVAQSVALAENTSGEQWENLSSDEREALNKLSASEFEKFCQLSDADQKARLSKLVSDMKAQQKAEEEAAKKAAEEAAAKAEQEKLDAEEAAGDKGDAAEGEDGAEGETPDVPETPDGGDEGETPETPEGPDGGDEGDVPETPETPDTPDTPDAPDTDDDGEDPEVPPVDGPADEPTAPTPEQPKPEAPAVDETAKPEPKPAPAEPKPEDKQENSNKTTEPIPDSGTYTPKHYSLNATTEMFIAIIGEQARQLAQENDLYASVMIAQAILESGSGNSGLAQAPNFNLFGIKGFYEGNSVVMRTTEFNSRGESYTLLARFRAYDGYADSLADYADLLANGLDGYYSGAWKSNAETPAEACDFLEGRYATSPTYSEKLQDLIATYDLERFDKPLSWEYVDTYEMQATDPETGELLFDEEGEPVMEQRTVADLLSEVTSHLGTPYVWGGADPITGFDCSGLMQYSLREAMGVDIPRTTYFQWRVGETVQFDDLQPGDLLFFDNDGDIHHVAMYLGDGYYIHAPHTGDVVRVTAMEDNMPSFAQRVLPTKPVALQVKAPTPDELLDEARMEAGIK
ncbi:glucosaminidase domain-containing protein [Parvibacter caecicola]|uniref:glucosaminidase domain-containing protein n=1 Tax=Parvibacter caecicola TaxID=747645 RepID=UPI0023F3ACC3|nr:glucosaminidase domain-containing protein [Parvibacter caecicola]